MALSSEVNKLCRKIICIPFKSCDSESNRERLLHLIIKLFHFLFWHNVQSLKIQNILIILNSLNNHMVMEEWYFPNHHFSFILSFFSVPSSCIFISSIQMSLGNSVVLLLSFAYAAYRLKFNKVHSSLFTVRSSAVELNSLSWRPTSVPCHLNVCLDLSFNASIKQTAYIN